MSCIRLSFGGGTSITNKSNKTLAPKTKWKNVQRRAVPFMLRKYLIVISAMTIKEKNHISEKYMGVSLFFWWCSAKSLCHCAGSTTAITSKS